MVQQMAMELKESIGKKTKIERYGWKIKDGHGALQYIAKSLLNIDDTYQRTQNKTKIVRIASEWSWIACGALPVAIREDGSRWVMDGGHRLAAAMLRADITDLPCVVFAVESVKQEAKGFLDIQINRKNITSAEKFRALLTIGNPNALFVNDLIEQSGRHAGGAATGATVSCLTAMLVLAETNRREILIKIWPLIVSLCEGQTIHVHLLYGIEYLQRHMEANEDSLIGTKWTNHAMQIGVSALMESMRKAAGLYGRGSPPIYAQGILTALNHGMRHRIPAIDIASIAKGRPARAKIDRQEPSALL